MEFVIVIGLVIVLVEIFVDGYDDYVFWKWKCVVSNYYYGCGFVFVLCVLLILFLILGF